MVIEEFCEMNFFRYNGEKERREKYMQWWQDKVVYQIYPKSFLDTNQDGIGDIDGIRQKLDYLQQLGVDLIWICPCYCSPFIDEGYDISDYYQIDPVFGSLADFEQLILEAKQKNIGILMDLVLNHCSDQHQWFQKAIDDPEGKYGKYFYIENFDGEHYPNNMRSVFGGPAWERLPNHPDKVYLHTFHKKQPDLNWENPQLRQEIYQMVNWWLEKGLAGFRIDAINHIKKVLPFRNFPADGSDGMVSAGYFVSQAKGLDQFLLELKRECFQKYNAFTVGEVFGITEELLEQYIGENGYFNSIFDFSSSHFGRNYTDQSQTIKVLSMEQFKQATFLAQEELKDIGTYSLVIENHDQPRAASHFLKEVNEKSKKLLAGCYFFQKGIPFIYQGQEIGMENKQFTSRDQIIDVDGINMYDSIVNLGHTHQEALATINALCRDHSRTPMQWDDCAYAGFSTKAPWQQVNENYKKINVKKQLETPDSLWYFYQKMIAIRKQYRELFVLGDFVPYLKEIENLVAYFRTYRHQRAIVLANGNSQELRVKNFASYQILINNDKQWIIEDDQIVLSPYQFVILLQQV